MIRNITQNRVVKTKDVKGFLGEQSEKRKSQGFKLFESYLANRETRGIVEDLEPSLNDPKKQRKALESMQMIHNQWSIFQEALKRGVSEATISANFGSTPRNIVKMIRYTSANSNISDILEVNTMSAMTGMVYYILPVARKTKKEGDVNAGDTLHDSLSTYFATETAQLQLVDTAGTYAVTSSYASPIRPYTVKIIAIGTGANEGISRVLATDDGNGNFIPTEGVNTAQTITAGVVDYSAKSVTGVEFDGGTSLANFNVYTSFNWDSEKDLNEHAELELILMHTRVDAYMHPIGYNFSATGQLLVDSTLGEKVDAMLDNTAMNQLKIEKDRVGVKALYQLACMTDALTFDTLNASAHSIKDHAQALLVAIKQAGASMYLGSERGGVSYVIAGAGAEAYMNNIDKYVSDNSQPRIGMYKAGMLGSLPVYVSNLIPKDDIVIGWKGTEDGDTPLIYAPFLDMATPSLTTKDFITQKGLASYYDIVPTKYAKNYVRRLKLQNLPALPYSPATV